MDVETTAIADVRRIVARSFDDARGSFCETYNQRDYRAAGVVATFVQDNVSVSRLKWTLRGLHFQAPPFAQGKLIRVVRGAIFDVAVDIRHGSPTFGTHVAERLSAQNRGQLWVPPGFAHGFLTLEPDTEVHYKVTDYFVASCDHGIAYDDPALDIEWPCERAQITLSDKDQRHKGLDEHPVWFRWAKPLCAEPHSAPACSFAETSP